MNEGIVPPYNLEAEQGCIGAAIIDPGNLIETDLKPDDFFLGLHRDIWGAMLKCYDAGVAVDLVTISDRLGQMGKLEEIGGTAKLTEFCSLAHMSFNYQYYVGIVKRYAWKRRCLSEINIIAQAVFDETADEQKFGQVVEKSVDCMLTGRTKNDTRNFGEVIGEVWTETMERTKNPVEVWGMKTGLSDLDTLLGGLQLREIFDISGAPGVGKSRLALAMAIGLAEDKSPAVPGGIVDPGNPGAIFSMEMQDIALGYRGLSAYAEVPTRLLKTGQVNDEQIVKLTSAYEKLSRLPIYINDQPQTIQSLRAELVMLQKRHGVKWFVLDYLMLLNGYENLEEIQRTAMLSRGIKHIVNMGFAGVVLHSVVKTGMEGQPKMSDLRGSGQVIHDADLVAFVTENPTNPSIMRLTFEKARDVSNGKKTLEFYAHTGYPKISNVVTRQVDLREL